MLEVFVRHVLRRWETKAMGTQGTDTFVRAQQSDELVHLMPPASEKEAQAWETTPGPRGSTFQPWEHCSPHLLCDTAGTISQRSKGRCSRSRLWGSGPVAWPTLTGRPPYICGGNYTRSNWDKPQQESQRRPLGF